MYRKQELQGKKTTQTRTYTKKGLHYTRKYYMEGDYRGKDYTRRDYTEGGL